MVRLHVSVQALFRRGLGILLRLGSMCALEWDACPFFVFRPSFVDYWRTWKYEISLLRGLVNDGRWIFHILESCSHGKFCILHLFDMQANIITTQSFLFPHPLRPHMEQQGTFFRPARASGPSFCNFLFNLLSLFDSSLSDEGGGYFSISSKPGSCLSSVAWMRSMIV